MGARVDKGARVDEGARVGEGAGADEGDLVYSGTPQSRRGSAGEQVRLCPPVYRLLVLL